MNTNPQNIIDIIERRKKGIDCTEQESAEVKGFVKDVIDLVGEDEVPLIKEIQEQLPVEYLEAVDEMEDGTSGQDRKNYTDDQDRDTYYVSN